MKYIIALVVVFLVAPFVFSEVKNSNKPAGGEWDLQLIKEWNYGDRREFYQKVVFFLPI
jgi:hypothetical protein